MKAYVILRKGFEYDDNIYTCYNDGGKPDLIVFTEEEAYEKVRELNIAEYKQESLTSYSYGLDEVLNVDQDEYFEFCEKLIEKYGKIELKNSWDSSENRLHPMANDEESKIYSEMVNLTFFLYMETEIDTQSFRNKRINDTLS